MPVGVPAAELVGEAELFSEADAQREGDGEAVVDAQVDCEGDVEGDRHALPVVDGEEEGAPVGVRAAELVVEGEIDTVELALVDRLADDDGRTEYVIEGLADADAVHDDTGAARYMTGHKPTQSHGFGSADPVGQ